MASTLAGIGHIAGKKAGNVGERRGCMRHLHPQQGEDEDEEEEEEEEGEDGGDRVHERNNKVSEG